MSPNDDLKALIRTIPDHPRPGIQFRDVTTLLLDAGGLSQTIARLAASVPDKPDLIAGVEARGFVVGAALAVKLGCGLLLVAAERWRSGLVVMGLAVVVAGLFRLLLPLRRIGFLAVRSRPVDVALMLATGVAVAVIALAIPHT